MTGVGSRLARRGAVVAASVMLLLTGSGDDGRGQPGNAVTAANLVAAGGATPENLVLAGRAAPATGTAPVSYSAPVSGRVLRRFEPPADPYGPGHRGVDLAATPGDVVRAAADATVTFAGAVAGRGVVVLAHADGIRTEYEPLRFTVRAGTTVRRGERIGALAGRHASCAPASCLHWGARRGERYLDPLALLRPLGPVRLLPWPRHG